MSLRWYQQEAIDELFAYFATNNPGGSPGNPIVAHPTGTGKSHVIGGFTQQALGRWPGQRFLMLTHVKELIEQNARKLLEMWPTAPLGINSAGLGQRDFAHPILFGGVASVIGSVEALGHRDILFIDECHLLSPDEDSRYRIIITNLKKANPYLKVVGLTATKYRLGQGLLTDDGLFTDVVHDMTTLENFDRLIAEGYLSPPIPKRTNTEIKVEGVRMAGGDFNGKQLQAASDQERITRGAVLEMLEHGQNRHSWLVFCSGIEHSEHVAQMLRDYGIPCEAIHSKIPQEERDRRIEAFKRGELRAVTNNNVLTTGFDHKPIDMIAMLRATASPVLWVQMIGRGMRPYNCNEETDWNTSRAFPFIKQNCLVLDFARNTLRLGPVNDPRIPKKKGPGNGEVPVKICETCGTYNHTRATHCFVCGTAFEMEVKIVEEASTEELLRAAAPVVETYNVTNVLYQKHDKKSGGIPSLKVSYLCNGGLHQFQQWVCLEHPVASFPAKRARDWWRQFHKDEPPATIDAALRLVSQLRTPKRIRVWVNKDLPEVLGYEY